MKYKSKPLNDEELRSTKAVADPKLNVWVCRLLATIDQLQEENKEIKCNNH